MDTSTTSQFKSQTPHGTPVPLNAGKAGTFSGASLENSLQKNFNPEQLTQPSIGVVVKPGEYHPGYIPEMLAYFDRPKTREIVSTFTWKSGAVDEQRKVVPNTPPHFSEFARKIGVTSQTLKNWAKKYPGFKVAYQQCQEILEEFLIDNGLTGAYGAVAMKFVAVNKTSMKDKTETVEKKVDINKFLDDLQSGKILPGRGNELIEDEDDTIF